MFNRRFVALALVITVFAAVVIATSMGGGAAGTHSMPNGETMQGDDMTP